MPEDPVEEMVSTYFSRAIGNRENPLLDAAREMVREEGHGADHPPDPAPTHPPQPHAPDAPEAAPHHPSAGGIVWATGQAAHEEHGKSH